MERYKFRNIVEKEFNSEKDKFGKGIEFETIEIVQKKGFIGFNKKNYYLRITFSKTGFGKPRNRALRLCINNNWKTATNDSYGYYKVPIRDRKISKSSWIRLKKYSVEHNNILINLRRF